jgi:hypothetical protein
VNGLDGTPELVGDVQLVGVEQEDDSGQKLKRVPDDLKFKMNWVNSHHGSSIVKISAPRHSA